MKKAIPFLLSFWLLNVSYAQLTVTIQSDAFTVSIDNLVLPSTVPSSGADRLILVGNLTPDWFVKSIYRDTMPSVSDAIFSQWFYNHGDNFIISDYTYDLSSGSIVSGSFSVVGNASFVPENLQGLSLYWGDYGEVLLATWSASAIPEPSTYAAVLGGLVIIGFYFKRRKFSKPHKKAELPA